MKDLGKKISQLAKDKQITIKSLTEQISMTETGYYAAIRNNSLKLDTLYKIADVLEVPVSLLVDDESPAFSQYAIGTGNIAGDTNKQKVTIGGKSAVKSSGMTYDEIVIKLLTCEKDREKDQEVYKKERESFTRELDTYKNILAQQSQLIERLSVRGN